MTVIYRCYYNVIQKKQSCDLFLKCIHCQVMQKLLLSRGLDVVLFEKVGCQAKYNLQLLPEGAILEKFF